MSECEPYCSLRFNIPSCTNLSLYPPCGFTCMQTKAGGAAKTFCAEEIWDVVVQDFMPAAEKVLKEAFKGKKKKGHMHPLYSLDNARVHSDIKELFHEDMVPLPPRSPDMHKVIEHIWNTISHDLKYNQLPSRSAIHKETPYSIGYWSNLVEDCARRLITVESVREDVNSLKDTYEYIVEHEGRYAPHGKN